MIRPLGYSNPKVATELLKEKGGAYKHLCLRGCTLRAYSLTRSECRRESAKKGIESAKKGIN